MSDESRIKDVIVELDNSCLMCNSFKDSYPGTNYWTGTCSKHLLELYNDIRSMPLLYKATLPEVTEELKRRKLL